MGVTKRTRGKGGEETTKKESERQSTSPHQKQDKTIRDISVQSGYAVLAISGHGRIPGEEEKSIQT